MKKLNSRETMILTITLIMGIVYVLYFLVVKPIQEGALNVDDRLRVDRQQLMKASQMVGQKPLIEARYQNLVDVIGTCDSDDAQMPTIVSKIENAARQANIHIGNIQPQKIATQKETSFEGVELEIDGQWLDIVQFLYALQERPNFYFISELNLEKYSDSTNSLRGRIVISRLCLVNP